MSEHTNDTGITRSVFISHSKKNFKVADNIRDILEAGGVSCWIAPRDIQPGKQYGASIIDGISNSSVFLLLLTDESNLSPAVQNEVERAFGYQKTIIPVRISDVKPGKEIEFFVSNAQWVDAIYQPLKRRMDEVAAIVQAIEMSAKPPPVQPEEKTLMGTVEKFSEQAFRHKTISFITGFLILTSLILLGIYLQSQSMGAIDKASVSIRQSGTEISSAAVTIKDSGEKVAALSGKVDGLKKETSENPRKELANMGLLWDESSFFYTLDDPVTTKLYLSGGMRLAKNLVINSMLDPNFKPGVAKMLMPGGTIEIYGECLPDMSVAPSYISAIYSDSVKRELFTALCNSNGEFTKVIKRKYEALARAGHDRKAIEMLMKEQKIQQTLEEFNKETATRDFSKEVETDSLKTALRILSQK